MNRLLSIKLIIRNWWRNKLYFFISLFSLTIGLACTNLLVTFFIHEYNIESTNPNRENIYILRQDSPMEEGKVTYTHIDAGNQIRNNYAEVENMLRMDNIYAFDFLHNGNKIPKATFLQMQYWLEQFVERADSSFAHFLIPLVIVGVVSCITVSVHTLLAAKTNPMESLKTE